MPFNHILTLNYYFFKSHISYYYFFYLIITFLKYCDIIQCFPYVGFTWAAQPGKFRLAQEDKICIPLFSSSQRSIYFTVSHTLILFVSTPVSRLAFTFWRIPTPILTRGIAPVIEYCDVINSDTVDGSVVFSPLVKPMKKNRSI